MNHSMLLAVVSYKRLRQNSAILSRRKQLSGGKQCSEPNLLDSSQALRMGILQQRD